MGTIISIFLGIGLVMITLWITAKIMDLEITGAENAAIATVAVLLNQIPIIGWILSIISYIVLLKKFTGEDIFPRLILAVIVLVVVQILSAILLGILLAGMLASAAL